MSESTNTTAPEERYRVATRTHVGLHRERNEDYLDIRRSAHGLLLVVCDGMGGHRGGERASRLAAEKFAGTVTAAAEGEDIETLLRRGVDTANQAITEEAQANAEYSGMGTTLVAALLRGEIAHIVNVGDSRAYRYESGTLERITRDHSHVWELVEQGVITEEAAEIHPQRNVITRALGGRNAEPDIYEIRLGPGDILLLCTDGLHGMIQAHDIAAALAAHADPARTCDDLVERALAAGGRDNVSVALARADDGAPIPESPTDPSAKEKKAGPGTSSSTPRSALLLLMLAVVGFIIWYAMVLGEREERKQKMMDASTEVAAPVPVPAPVQVSPDTSDLHDSMNYSVTPDNDIVRPGDTLEE